MRILVQLAETKEQYEEAFRLLQDGRQKLGFGGPTTTAPAGGLWITKQHALPCTNTIVALAGKQVVGAITLFGESAFRLPIEEQADLSEFRRGLNGRLAEFSLPGLREGTDERDVLLALYHYALCFGSTYCNYEAFVTHAPADWGQRYASLLQYEPLLVAPKLQGNAFYRSAREGADFRRHFNQGFEAEFRFPERKFYLVAHQNLNADILRYLFREKSDLFNRLSDIELRVLKNFYDHGHLAPALPERQLALPFQKLPQSPRFAMSCEGHLIHPDGDKIHVEVLDVSREGLKLRAESPLDIDQTYALTLQVGILKQAEVIGTAVWCNPDSGLAGIRVKSGDTNWARLLEYLEGVSRMAA